MQSKECQKESLLNCPFCGGEATFIGNTRTIKCKCCGGAFVCTNPLITALEVAAAWNTRKPMERIVERLEESKTNFSRMGTLQSAYYDKGLDKAIEIVKGGGEDEVD